ncbi:MAG: hypothetical protein WB662_15275, partial [Methyloceanibacter sp.]
MRRRAAPDPLSADPSCPAPDIDRFSSTESRFPTSINRVLQHNPPDSGHSSVQMGCPKSANNRHRENAGPMSALARFAELNGTS